MDRDQPTSVSCPLCSVEWPVNQAVFCDCVTRFPSPVCPSCGRCFCSSSQGIKDRFWQSAPDDLWIRRREWQTRTSGQFSVAEIMNAGSGPKTILVIDDERLPRLTARKMIERLGYRVLVAKDGVEGLEIARTEHPSMVLTDALMPRLDGRELARTLKQEPDTTHIAVVIMTSIYNSRAQKNEMLSVYRADDVVSKPVTGETLERLLNRLVGRP